MGRTIYDVGSYTLRPLCSTLLPHVFPCRMGGEDCVLDHLDRGACYADLSVKEEFNVVLLEENH